MFVTRFLTIIFVLFLLVFIIIWFLGGERLREDWNWCRGAEAKVFLSFFFSLDRMTEYFTIYVMLIINYD